MKQILNLKLAQQLTLTPQLKQSLRLLQLPAVDLEHEIQQAIDSNPLLERVENEVINSLDAKNKNDVTRQAKFVGDSYSSKTTPFKYATIHITFLKPHSEMCCASAKLI